MFFLILSLKTLCLFKSVARLTQVLVGKFPALKRKAASLRMATFTKPTLGITEALKTKERFMFRTPHTSCGCPPLCATTNCSFVRSLLKKSEIYTLRKKMTFKQHEHFFVLPEDKKKKMITGEKKRKKRGDDIHFV